MGADGRGCSLGVGLSLELAGRMPALRGAEADERPQAADQREVRGKENEVGKRRTNAVVPCPPVACIFTMPKSVNRGFSLASIKILCGLISR